MNLKLLPAVLLFLTQITNAQTPQVSWGEDQKLESDVEKIVSGEGMDMITLGHHPFERWNGLTRYDAAYKAQQTNNLGATDENTSLLFMLNVGAGIVVFTCRKDDKAFNYEAQKFNSKTLQPEGKMISLCAMVLTKKHAEPTADFMFSEDSSKLVLLVTAPNFDEEAERYSMAVLNSQMQLLWQRNAALPYDNKRSEKITFYVTNNGQVGIPVNIYQNKISDYDLHTQNINIPAYTTRLFLYTNAGSPQQEIPVNAAGKYIHTLQLVKDVSGKLLFGLYKNNSAGKIAGYFTLPFADNATTLQATQLNDFPADLLSQIDRDDQGSDKKSDPGLSMFFYLRDVLQRSNGTTDYLIQYANGNRFMGTPEFRGAGGRAFVTSGNTAGNSFGDIIDIAVDAKGRATYTRVPRLIQTSNYWFGSILTTTYADKLLLFYVDDNETLQQDIDKKPNELHNVIKSAFTMATIDGKGRLTRTVVYDSKKDDISTCVRLSTRNAANEFTLYALQGLFSRKFRIGKLVIK